MGEKSTAVPQEVTHDGEITVPAATLKKAHHVYDRMTASSRRYSHHGLLAGEVGSHPTTYGFGDRCFSIELFTQKGGPEISDRKAPAYKLGQLMSNPKGFGFFAFHGLKPCKPREETSNFPSLISYTMTDSDAAFVIRNDSG